tara:strand:- start:457 stop:744 length:288 start_codon:yes stop_codon:yes gene_type:complete
MAAKKKTNTEDVLSLIQSLPTRGGKNRLESRLSPEQKEQLRAIADIFAKTPHVIERAGWEELAKMWKEKWGLETLSSRTLRRAVTLICDAKKEEE